METISMFLDIDCAMDQGLPEFIEDKNTQSVNYVYASSGHAAKAYDFQLNPHSSSLSYDERWFEAVNWDLNDLASPPPNPGRASPRVENVSPPTSSCWSSSPRASCDASPDNSPTTINPLATLKSGFPLSTTVKLSDIRTDQGPEFGPISSSGVGQLDIPVSDASQQKRTNGRELPTTVNGWKNGSAAGRPVVRPTSFPNDRSRYGLTPPTAEYASSSWNAQQFPRSPSGTSTVTAAIEEALLESAAEDEDSNASDSDDYRPSRSPSVSRHSTRTSLSPPCFTSSKNPRFSRKTTSKKSSRKAKGSAALALAVVMQLGDAKRVAKTEADPDPGDEHYDPVKMYQDINGYEIIRKRKNQPIPLPIPIPNLNKKSRGRKVPFVANPEDLAAASSGLAGVTHSMVKIEDPDDDYILKTSRSKRRKITPAVPPVPPEDGLERSYVCVIPGCGKCFVRGEHLKRHVRSIHTHDKRCDKSFSRRDNLGQHVRLHLQS
ncbi:hypothetical protein CPB83DRAFT_926443 [Crepidotus variabilis]|uniref:C2H2-type domain-containing protein n=1 Tax=Crepidotus variabilis TaxID=179855 RepID=A0A9P6EIN9_9AGAR|nr:hypothetical protein CPB83DRAFT_926443 [Crepidotus variabilis]